MRQGVYPCSFMGCERGEAHIPIHPFSQKLKHSGDLNVPFQNIKNFSIKVDIIFIMPPHSTLWYKRY